MIYGYARVSTPHQKIDRQIDNMKRIYSDIEIYEEKYTGTKLDRPVFSKLLKRLIAGDTIVFDEVSRMSRNAEEGFTCYKELYEKGINLVFIKDPALNTDNFRRATESINIDPVSTGKGAIDNYINEQLKLVNNLILALAEEQIKSAFEVAQKEVDYLHKRTSEGMKRAKAEGKRVGTETGRKLEVKKKAPVKEQIRKYSKRFDGTLNDKECIKLVDCSRNTFYKYLGEMYEE